MDSHKKHYILVLLTFFGAAALSIILFFVIYRFEGFSTALGKLIDILKPLIYGMAIAYLLKPLCNYYERKLLEKWDGKRKKLANILAVVGSMLTAFIFVYLLMIIIIPQVIGSVTKIIESIPEKMEQASAWIEATLERDTATVAFIKSSYNEVSAALDSWLTDIVPNIRTILEGVGEHVWRSVIFFKNMLIGVIVAVYLLLSRRKFARQGKMVLYSIVKSKWADMIMEELRYADRIFIGFLNGKILDSAIIGVICYVCCLILKFPNPMLISAIIGVTNIIPFFGPFIGAVPAALIIFIESPIQTVWFILFVLVLQQVDGNIIGPRILGNSTGLSSFWVLFAIMFFGGLWGFIGMIIGVPLLAVIYDVFRKLVLYGLKKNGCEEMISENAAADYYEK
ncbi:MAG: AI-2E family transporter [Clostridiales bacterium]|nr:AI-2E family transporter [Clostridiales bacterium]